ncbi:MAG: flagellar biosynthetic protein FliQ [Bryobacteraceae bacterium]
MTPNLVVDLIRQTLLTAFWLAAPLLAIGFAAAICISLAQIATSMQDNAFSAIPRLVTFLISFLLLMPWLIQKSMTFTLTLWSDLGRYAR